MINKLFIYGSLLETDNLFGSYLQQYGTFYSKGKFKGKLFDVGEYPGALYNPAGTYWVYGSIVVLDNVEEALKVIDDYEGYGYDQLQPNLFIRKLLTIITGDKPVKCWVYLYNHPVNHLKQIHSGDYIAYKKT